MVAKIFTASKSSFSISTTTTEPATSDAAGYAALTYQQACPAQSIGAFGISFESVTFDDLCTGTRIKLKGINDNGDMEVVLGYDDTDDGYDYIIDAAKDTTASNYHFKITMPNKQNLTGTDAVFYFSGKVMMAQVTPGDANTPVTLNVTIGISSDIIIVKSTAGV